MSALDGGVGEPGKDGANGKGGTALGVPGGNGGHGGTGGPGQSLDALINQGNYAASEIYLGTLTIRANLYADSGRYGGSGGAAGGAYITDEFSAPTTYVLEHDIYHGVTGNGGAGGAGGSGGNAHVTVSTLATSDSLSISAHSGNGAVGGTGGAGGKNVYGWIATDDFAGNSDHTYVTYSHHSRSGSTDYYAYFLDHGGSAGDGGIGGSGGAGGTARVDLTGSTLTGALDNNVALFAQGGGGGEGNGGGDAGAGLVPGLAGRGGTGGRGGDAFVSAQSNLFAPQNAGYWHHYVIALGVVGGGGSAGGHGGAASYSHALNYVHDLDSTSVADIYLWGSGGAGGTGGRGGNAVVLFTNNTINLTPNNDFFDLNLFLLPGLGGTGGAGGYSGGGTDGSAGASGAAGTATLTVSGNVFDGGDGIDTLSVTGINSAAPSSGLALFNVAIDLAAQTVRIGNGISTIVNFENIDLSGDGFDPGDMTKTVSLTGDGQNNVLIAGGGADTLRGGGGADTLNGFVGTDRMYGGPGNDTYMVDNTGDRAYEYTAAGVDDGGIDTVIASATFTLGAFVENLDLTGSDAVNGYGNDLANAISGNDGDNKLMGYAGADAIDGGAGADRMYGGAGDDTYIVDNAGDRVYEYTVAGRDDGGTDTVDASVSLTLGNFVENLNLLGPAVSGYGNGSGNRITGNDIANTLKGLNGDDVLNGGAGNDSLYGGTGADSFVFAHFGAANGIDHVRDFETGIDHLVFAAADFGFAPGHLLTASELRTIGSATGPNPQFVYKDSNHTLYWDTNGGAGGGSVAIAIFDNGVAPAAADFVFN